jgi:hypothetical protein
LLRAKTLFGRDDDRVHFGHHLKDAPRKTLPADIGKVLKRLHYPLDVIVLCVRGYVAYSLGLRNLKR